MASTCIIIYVVLSFFQESKDRIKILKNKKGKHKLYTKYVNEKPLESINPVIFRTAVQRTIFYKD
ncbi:hypothetical protein C4H11_04365 [Bacteroides zoogleoformans]|uniref:Uncharacterized protein n=1 Tax=Bacteroides zoogleoformans TaxID=28119 RepID=A0ABN5IJC0_9BACE|nr:hypothetical protein C4H11_04365 [Bacteroides zoogleoformans]